MNQERVIFCGENPEIRLYPADSDEMIAIASYWRCTYSAHGPGQVLFLWVSPEVMPVQAIYTDNEPLARFLAQTLVQHFDGLQPLGFPAIAPQSASLVQSGNSHENYHVQCLAEIGTVEVEWRNVLDVRLPRAYTNLFQQADTETQYDVTTVICPTKTASLTIRGNSISGRVISSHDGTMHRSSAFLAFSETWTERDAARPE